MDNPSSPKRINGRFAPGHTGNAGGRPKLDRDVVALARQHTTEAVQTLVRIMRDKKENGAVRASAAQALLDRGWGKAPQMVAVGGLDAQRAEELRLVMAELTGPIFRPAAFANPQPRIIDAEGALDD